MEIRVGRTAAISVAVVTAVLFVLLTQGIHEFRDNLSKLRELRSLRQKISEQNLTLYNLHAKFEGLMAEVERLRCMDNRLKILGNDNVPPLREAREGIGGTEVPQQSAADRLDHLLDRKFDEMKKELLVDVKDLDLMGEKLDRRRRLLESVPRGWPVRGPLSSGFGVRTSPFTDTPVFHHGLDIVAVTGTPVLATASGTVVRSGHEPLLGNVVVVEHGAGYQTIYAHLSARSVESGAFVERGEEVGKVGATGRVTGPHLHYEVRVNGLKINPARFLN